MNTYVAFDVETPNFRNDRMSAIGVCLVEEGEITREFYSLVNPECSFDAFNIRLTEITPAMVRNQPTFPLIWELIRPMMERGVLLAHNAPFDLGVLGRCLADYGIDWKPAVRYACTCQMGRRLLPELPHHRLNDLCEHFSLPLRHHNALSDTRACALLLGCYLRLGADPDAFCRSSAFGEAGGRSRWD